MLNYSKSYAGRIGAEKSKLVALEKKRRRIEDYNLNPKKCLHCSQVISYDGRHKKFCNSSCAATYNNFKRERKYFSKAENVKIKKENKITWYCLNCKAEHQSLNWRIGKYCNTKCQHEAQYKNQIDNWNIKAPGKGAIKKYLIETFGYLCESCGINTWNNKPIILEIEHKDGNSENNTKENLCLICPNCHSQTDTYKGRNKGNGRFKRRQRYQEGKSY